MRRIPSRAFLLLTTLGLAACNQDSQTAAGQPTADGLEISLTPPCLVDSRWANSGHYVLADRSVTATLVDRQGRLWLAGSTASGSYVRRLLADGALDSSFASNGTLELSFGDDTLRDRPAGLALGPDDDAYLLVNNDLASSATPATSYSLLHLLENGSVDAAFHNGIDGGVVSASGQARNFYRNSFGMLEVMLTPAAGSWGLREYFSNGSLNTALGSGGLYSETGNLLGRTGPMAGDVVDVYDDCSDGNCGLFLHRFTSSGAPIQLQVDAPSFDVAATISGPSATYIQGVLTLFNPLHYLADPASTPLPVAVDPSTATAYPDGYLLASGDLSLSTEKQLTDGALDATFCNGSADTSLLHEPRAGAQLAVAAGGAIFVSGTVTEAQGDVLDYGLAGDVFKLRGSAPDTTPTSFATTPTQTYDPDTGYYTLQAITVRGLGDGVGVPARLLPSGMALPERGWELSIDNGATWYNGWLWVHNGSKLLARRPDVGSATLTIGGVLSPNSPGVPMGDVLTLELASDGVTVTEPAGNANVTDGGSSGGALDVFAVFGLLLVAGIGQRRYSRRS